MLLLLNREIYVNVRAKSISTNFVLSHFLTSFWLRTLRYLSTRALLYYSCFCLSVDNTFRSIFQQMALDPQIPFHARLFSFSNFMFGPYIILCSSSFLFLSSFWSSGTEAYSFVLKIRLMFNFLLSELPSLDCSFRLLYRLFWLYVFLMGRTTKYDCAFLKNPYIISYDNDQEDAVQSCEGLHLL